jgi:hypothetical protein
MSGIRIFWLSLLLVAGCLALTSAQAGHRPGKPARALPSKPPESGQIVCTRLACRPVRAGCRIEQMNIYNEEVCKPS